MKRIFYTGIVVITIAFSTFIFHSKNITDSINIGNFLLKDNLNKSLIDEYSNAKGEEKKQIENRIKDFAIRDMELDEWSKYLEEIKMKTYHLDIVGDSENEFLVSLNLSKNLSVVGIYRLEGDNYLLSNKIENLTNVKKIRVEKNKKTNQRFLVLEEFLDERVGAYFVDQFVRIFVEVDESFEEVFRQSIDYEAYYYEKWINPNKESSKWYKLNEKNVIEYDFENDKDTTIDIQRELTRHEGLDGTVSKIPTEFKEVEKKNFNIKYIWSKEYRAFIMGKGEIISTGEEVAILEDTSKTVDYLLNLGDKYYKVINRNMKTKYIKQDQIKTKDK